MSVLVSSLSLLNSSFVIGWYRKKYWLQYSISPDVGRFRLVVELKDEDNSNEVEDKGEN